MVSVLVWCIRMSKTCSSCGVFLVEGENWYPSSKKNHKYVCRGCVDSRKRRYLRKRKEKVLDKDFMLSLMDEMHMERKEYGRYERKK